METTETRISAAGDPFAAALQGCTSCFGGYVTITIEEDGAEYDEAVPCIRCAREDEEAA